MLKNLFINENIEHSPLFSEYLRKKCISRQLLYKYVKNEWLDKVSHGVYKKKNTFLEPYKIIESLQKQLNLKLHIGAHSALKLHGVNFNARTTNNYIVYIPENFQPSKWLKSINQILMIYNNFLKTEIGISKINKIKTSSPERAILETISLIPKYMDFEECFHLMELLPTLRSQLLQNLLEQCTSIKTKRLFLYMAEEISHTWFKTIKTNKIDQGSGDRQIVKNGTYNKKYKIIIPKRNP